MANFSDHHQYDTELGLLIQKALQLHSTQVRKDGTPYAAHLLTVAGECLRLGSFINKAECTCLAGMFHDSLEDIPGMTEGYLSDQLKRYGPDVVNIVKEVTEDKRLKGATAKKDYINRILTMSTPALIVSLADKQDNIQGYNNLVYLNHTFNKKSVKSFYRGLIYNYKTRISQVKNSTLKKHLELKLKGIIIGYNSLSDT